MKRVSFVLLAFLSTSCSEATLRGVVDGVVALSEDADPTFLVFGGRGHRTFLGCLCDESDRDSIFNRYGDHGSSSGSASIHNWHGQFGSRSSRYSACNPSAADPPVVVDEEGGYYGRMTVNRSHRERFGDHGFLRWLRDVCD